MTPIGRSCLWVAFVGLSVVFLHMLAGCTPPDTPRLQTYGVFGNPICIIFCDTVVETANGEGDGSISTGSVSVSQTPRRSSNRP